MRKYLTYTGLAILIFLSGCVTPEESYCYPHRIKTTSLYPTSALTVDYYYTDDNVLDKIDRGDYQTYYYTYNENKQISKIEREKVLEFRKYESQYIYEDELVIRIDNYEMGLDPYSHENIDTSFVGYSALTYSGNKVVSETEYSYKEKTQEYKLENYFEFNYDSKGNMSKLVNWNKVNGDTIEAYTYSYDLGKDPLYAVNLGFTRESHVNNKVKIVDLLNKDTYRQELKYNGNTYAEQINLIEEANNDAIKYISVEYTCK